MPEGGAELTYYQLLCRQSLRDDGCFSNITLWYLMRQEDARKGSRKKRITCCYAGRDREMMAAPAK